MSKKKLEKDLKEKDLNTEISEVMEKVFTNVTKLKCNFEVYKNQRTAHNMPITEKCQKCGKKFKENDELYQATEETKKENYIICNKCANK